ncbi:MAG: chromosome segregation protein SMC [Clostridia bacterium]|nr:chromosome segregation protein SMC [Lachnospiraceae bacterium]NCB99315.1 chromosome segregation protein SMC [Clostridia bacterium]NCD01464.1 chromosome segregation protein SMC [Clostridia bacterium]
MYLKSIELQGFKSFANKTILKFNKGITGIVGPNGSGKSNVADAVRWVLGEQSAKQLRGSKMEDIIFSGTENRKPLGFAYVAITIDNSDHKLAIEYDELTVARRVYRSGESEYLINGTVSRLRDVQELFFDTGIGKEGYSIIGQGQIDKILSGKPEDRRELFDEAVGIVKYKKRKAMAEKNLNIEKQNLYRVTDILSELEKQIGPLSRQSEKAKEYLKYRDALKILDVQMYLSEYSRLKESGTEYEKKISIAKADIESSQNDLEQAKADYAKMEGLLEECNSKIDTIKGKIADIQLSREKNESEIRLLKEQIRSVEASSGHYKERLQQIQEAVDDKNKTKSSYEEEEKSLTEKIMSLQDVKNQAEDQLDTMTGSIEKLRQAIEEKNGDIIEALSQSGSVKAKLQRYDTMLEQIQIRKSELNQRLIVLQSEAASRTKQLADYADEKETLDSKKTDLQTRLAEHQKKGQDIQARIDKCHESLTAKEQEYHRLSSRFQTLQGITERYEGYGNSIKRIMEQKKQVPGIIGVVADIIKVSKTYETAIETALGGSIQNVVTKDEKTAKIMIEHLKKNRFGRATFLPLTSITSRTLKERESLLNEKGVLGIASDLVEHAPEFTGLAEYLLGRVVVTDTMDNALKLAKKYRYSLRMVTLDGESLNPGGSISGGAFKNSSNLLGRHREMEEMQRQMEQLKTDLNLLNRQTDEAHDEKRENKRHISGIQEDLQEIGLRANTLYVNMNQLKSSESSQSNVYDELSAEDRELKRQTAEIDTLKAELIKEQESHEFTKKEAESAIEALSVKLEEEVNRQQKVSTQTSELGMDFSSYVQKQNFLKENLKRIVSEISSLLEESQQLNLQIDESQREITAKEAQISEMETQAQSIYKGDDAFKSELNEYVKSREEMSIKQKHFFEHREQLSDRCSLLDKELFRLEHLMEKCEEDRNSLSNYMWETYELTYNSALQLKPEQEKKQSIEEIRRNISELKKSIKALGNINLNAIEEFKEVSERYTTLKTQHDDLVEAEGKLTDIIHDLDAAMREQFQKNFTAIQENFNRVFKELFGGGKGTLELMEDVDILDAGIRIVAQPPGKKLQNMMQLSGGEKALTAIALLFAIQSLKPSPFCLLDEIEAALDDANVKRYARYLNNLTEDTQFIIITHRRGTMNAADVLYGVTMQEKGISALVSVNLIENELTK